MSRRTRASRLGVVGVLFGLLAVVLLPATAHADGADAKQGDTPPGKAWIRAGHFVSGMGAVSIRLSPQSGSAMTLAQSVAYGSVTKYRQVTPGTYTVSVRPQGAASDTRPMLRRTLELTAGKAGTVALLGTKSAPRLATLTDDLTPPAAGTARVRVLSGSTEASALSIRAVGGPRIASDVVLGQTTAYATVPQGSWTLALDAKGSDVEQAAKLSSGGVYTAVVLDGDETSDGKLRLKLVTDAQGVARTPEGGAATGLGGTAGTGDSLPFGTPALIALGVVGVALVGAGSVGARRVSPGSAGR